MPTYHKHLKKRLLSAIGMWEGPWFCCLKCNGHGDALTWNKAGFPCIDLNEGSSFISKDKGMSKSSVESLEKALVLPLISTRGLTCLWQLERNMEFNASKGDDAWLLKIYLRVSTSHREASLLPCQASRRIWRCLSLLDRSPDATEQTRDLKGHSHPNSRM